AKFSKHCAVQRISRTWCEHIVARVEQSSKTVVDDFAGAVANHGALNVLKAIGFGARADGVDRRAFTQRITVPVEALAHGALHGFNHVRRRWKVELAGISDVEVQDLVTL